MSSGCPVPTAQCASWRWPGRAWSPGIDDGSVQHVGTGPVKEERRRGCRRGHARYAHSKTNSKVRCRRDEARRRAVPPCLSRRSQPAEGERFHPQCRRDDWLTRRPPAPGRPGRPDRSRVAERRELKRCLLRLRLRCGGDDQQRQGRYASKPQRFGQTSLGYALPNHCGTIRAMIVSGSGSSVTFMRRICWKRLIASRVATVNRPSGGVVSRPSAERRA